MHFTKKYLDKALRRLLSKRAIAPSGCWIWTAKLGQTDKPKEKRYGLMHFNGKSRIASRVSYMLHTGDFRLMDRPDIVVMHKCDNPRCVNPDHLTIGSHHENMKDKKEKGRHRVCPHCNRGLDVKD